MIKKIVKIIFRICENDYAEIKLVPVILYWYLQTLYTKNKILDRVDMLYCGTIGIMGIHTQKELFEHKIPEHVTKNSSCDRNFAF